MATKKPASAAKKPAATKAAAKAKDLPPKKDPKGGLPAIQKTRGTF